MKTPQFIFVLSLILAFQFSCKSDDDSTQPDETEDPMVEDPIPDEVYDVYIVGKALGKPVFWKNGNLNLLESEENLGTATGILKVMDDIYISGELKISADKSVPVYWKNGEMTTLTDETAIYSTSGIYVQGNDVWVSSTKIQVPSGGVNLAGYWKNGIWTQLGLGSNHSHAGGIELDGSDVYVGGFENHTGCYWLNGARHDLTTSGSYVYGMKFHEGDKYYVGAYSNSIFNACYWKNGSLVDLSDHTNSSRATCIIVENENVYVGGREVIGSGNLAAVFWKDGVKTNITDGTIEAYVNDIEAKHSDVFVVYTQDNFPFYWKNGTSYPLEVETSSSGNANGILVTPKE